MFLTSPKAHTKASLVLSIPVFLLWKVKMKLKQKLGLAIFLTLNIWMVLISLIRAALAEVDGPNGKVLDVVWCLFWIYIEAFVAIFVASLTALRFIFARQGARVSTEVTRHAFLHRRPLNSVSLDSLPEMPSPVKLSEVIRTAVAV